MLRSSPVPERLIRVTDVGWKARRLVDGASTALVIAALSRSLYLEVAGEIVWLGPPGATLHARAIVASDLPDVAGATRLETLFDLGVAREWRPPALPASVTRAVLTDEGRRLISMVGHLGRLDGFGALLVGRRPAFPLDHASDDARRFLEACALGDAPAAAAIGERLLGLGPGLTPAGDDLIGGAFFAWGPLNAGWREAAAMIRARAAERTHRISAALLGDLLDGEGYAPLHELSLALARSDAASALEAAARLVRIGHSSGWDILTGFLGALGALPEA